MPDPSEMRISLKEIKKMIILRGNNSSTYSLRVKRFQANFFDMEVSDGCLQSYPDVPVPMYYISLTYDGFSH